MPMVVTAFMTTCLAVFFVYMVSSYSALGTLVMSSGSMKQDRIIGSSIEDEMTPTQLSDELFYQKRKNSRHQLPIREWYSSPSSGRNSSTQSREAESAPSESESELRRRRRGDRR